MNKDIVSQAEQNQSDKLSEIGAYLRQAREERLLTLEQVAAKTLIQARLLNAIEHGKLHQLPEPVYIRGFIKRYADALGLSGAEVANAFPAGSGLRTTQPSWKNSPAAQLRPIHLYLIYVLLIVAAVSGLSYLMSRSASWVSAETNNVIQAPATETTTPEASPTASPAPQATTPAASDKPVRVAVTLTEQSWLRVEVDGQTDFQGILPEGTERTWTADSQLTVRAGNAGGVQVSYNDSKPESMGAAGNVEEVTFSASQDSASLPATAPLQ
ncbi:helix-turn-helix domain-containing protein [Oculatella sp. FACHB-28]|uniref:helix-turn-helix domain-containing protein n=1 Tax=Cyanophyceae TaxID=3028117 RepID=UPI00168433C9|nr:MULTISPECIES: RodZ domain-containing protein [Cyanophyceae]MBD1870602.1 helix-turn-helix domain-containing protein [Cyanobacteria bacterium FACHB-471]MBD1995485.1 helix-turn-helix domain-containing protein [Leptolyngbya sp. FACHB-541]MBD2056150.1 helix-turn-helix domain-containing protein [Oculatella sp. FACHB-28]